MGKLRMVVNEKAHVRGRTGVHRWSDSKTMGCYTARVLASAARPMSAGAGVEA